VRRYHLYPVLPCLALALMPVLPFVNSTGLWFGLPRMIVWASLSCAALTVSLFCTDRELHAREQREERS
jgi:hypothetical protein